MTARSGPLDSGDAPRPGRVAALRRRGEDLVEAIGRDRRVRRLQAVLQAADEAGGGILAAGLAFHALFALLPALLLLSGLAGWLIDDPATRAALVGDLVRRLPPLAGPVERTLDRLVSDRGTFSIIGLLGLAWGASNFYGSLDEAMERVFPGGRERSLVERRIRGFGAVGVLIAAAVATVVTGSAWSYVESAIGSGDDKAFWRLAGPGTTALVMSAAVLFVYRVVPTAPPDLRAAWLPALVVGTAIALLTNFYTILAPRIIGSLQAFGVLATLFGTLVWLSWVFQLLMTGAAWARLRRDERALATPDASAPADGRSDEAGP